MSEKILQIIGQLMRKADGNMPSSEFKDGYITALKDIYELLKEKEN